MPQIDENDKCPHGVARGRECGACIELVRKYVIPRKPGSVKINTEPIKFESEEKNG